MYYHFIIANDDWRERVIAVIGTRIKQLRDSIVELE
jgi:hypothetical protein